MTKDEIRKLLKVIEYYAIECAINDIKATKRRNDLLGAYYCDQEALDKVIDFTKHAKSEMRKDFLNDLKHAEVVKLGKAYRVEHLNIFNICHCYDYNILLDMLGRTKFGDDEMAFYAKQAKELADKLYAAAN